VARASKPVPPPSVCVDGAGGPPPRTSDSVTFTAASSMVIYDTITFLGTSSTGYQTPPSGRWVRGARQVVVTGLASTSEADARVGGGACSLRFFTITSPSDLDAVNRNIQRNGGKVTASPTCRARGLAPDA